MFDINLCKSKGSYEVRPKKNLKLDLKKLKKSFKTIVDTPILLVIEKEDEIIIHEHGRLVFKKLQDKEKIRGIADEIYRKAA